MAPKLKPLKKLIFGGFLGKSPQNFLGEELTFAAQQLYAKILDFDLLCLREERTRFRKKKKEKNLIAIKSGLVGMKRYLNTYNCEIFFAVFD